MKGSFIDLRWMKEPFIDNTTPPTRWEIMNEDTRPDAALGLEGVPHTGEAIGDDGMLVEPQSEDFKSARQAKPNPSWFKGAVFYEVLVRAFSDSNGDGTGDLRGLASRLDYLEWLGVDCLWLPPFYASPLRDGGYDISDFRAVLPEFGTVEDFVYLLEEAHRRGIRVITDLVLNHTSDAHPWFQESRQNPDAHTTYRTCSWSTAVCSSPQVPPTRRAPSSRSRCARPSTCSRDGATSPVPPARRRALPSSHRVRHPRQL
jgi:hypothetical protein